MRLSPRQSASCNCYSYAVALGCLLEVLQLPPESGGAFVTGTTVTNVPTGTIRYLTRYCFLANPPAAMRREAILFDVVFHDYA